MSSIYCAWLTFVPKAALIDEHHGEVESEAVTTTFFNWRQALRTNPAAAI